MADMARTEAKMLPLNTLYRELEQQNPTQAITFMALTYFLFRLEGRMHSGTVSQILHQGDFTPDKMDFLKGFNGFTTSGNNEPAQPPEKDKNGSAEKSTPFAPSNNKPNQPLKTIRRPIPVVNEQMPIIRLFYKFIELHTEIAAVVGEYGETTGLVTMEDVVETLLGLEFMDETDNIEDMQVQARKNWEARAKRLGIIE
jgi:hypothetical protein